MAQVTTLADLKSLINDRRRDITDDVVDMDTTGLRAINQTLELMQQLHDWEFTIKRSTINFHEGITWYSLPSDFKTIKDVRRQKPSLFQEWTYVDGDAFDNQTMTSHRMSIDTRFDSENKVPTEFLRLEADGNQAQINTATSVTADGTWTPSGASSTIGIDSFEFFDLPASLKFDMAGTTGTLTNDDMQAKDLRRFETRAKEYFHVFFPTVTNFRSLELRLGTDASNYYSATVTTDYLGFTPVVGWNTFEFDVWDTKTGSPDMSQTDYIVINLAFKASTTDANFRFQNIWTSEDIPLDLFYYSTDMVYDVDNAETTLRFQSMSQTTDYPLWTGKWNYVNESFIDGVLEQIFWITGETDDQSVARQKQVEIFNQLKGRIPSKTRKEEIRILTGSSSGNNSHGGRGHRNRRHRHY